jgi:hypothetical protein
VFEVGGWELFRGIQGIARRVFIGSLNPYSK